MGTKLFHVEFNPRWLSVF